MGLIQKLKSALGLDGADAPDSGAAAPRDVDVTVEREPSSESEDAVKGTETAASPATERDEPDVGGGAGESSEEEETPIEEAEPDDSESPVDEPSDDGTVQTEIEGLNDESADDSSGDATDETPVEDAEEAVSDADEEAEGASAGTDDESSTGDTDETSTEDADDAATEDAGTDADDAATEDAGTDADDAAEVPDDPVTEISGIGPAYGQRLSDAGVETVADLAAADPDELGAATDISAARIEGWIDAAAEY
jgi:predicted flap endonuclease-1-like 5' DNA nuclease